MSIPEVSAASSQGPVQVVKKVQDQAELQGRQAVALIQAAGETAPGSDTASSSALGQLVSTVA